MYNLNGKVALVTGAASKPGFGHAIAVRLAKEGADVVVADKFLPPDGLSEDDRIESWQGLPSVVQEIEALGRKAIAVKCDTTDSSQVQSLAAAALKTFGKVNILVNNAGIREPEMPVIDFDEQAWNRTISVNLTGTFLCSKYIGKAMVDKKQGGKIINLSSSVGKQGAPRMAAYVASKFGVVGLTQTLALELAPHRINVNAICPGMAPTNLSIGSQVRGEARRSGISIEEATDRIYTHLKPLVPLGRIARADDIASLVAFLASGESDYMTGLAIPVAGGMLMT